MNIGKACKAFFAVLKGLELVPQSELEKLTKESTRLENDLASSKEKLAGMPDIENVQKEAHQHGAVYCLNLLQREGRMVDFLMEDISAYTSEQVGTAVREIHAGSQKVLHQSFHIERIRKEDENQTLTIDGELDPSQVKLTGNVGDSGPYTGMLTHKGWKAQLTGCLPVALRVDCG